MNRRRKGPCPYLPVDPIADYRRGLRQGALVGVTAGAALVAFALWIGVLQGSL